MFARWGEQLIRSYPRSSSGETGALDARGAEARGKASMHCPQRPDRYCPRSGAVILPEPHVDQQVRHQVQSVGATVTRAHRRLVEGEHVSLTWTLNAARLACSVRRPGR